MVKGKNNHELLHSQRLETLGLLSGGVAHDFNNVLTGILGHITFLKTILPKEGTHKESLAAIEDGARKSSLMTQQILRFARYDPQEEPMALDISGVVKRTMVLLRGAISPEYRINIEIPQEKIEIRATEGKIAQVLINLVVNARDASERNQSITIGLKADENFVELFVRDEGIGMSPEIQARIFEPFFSTKKEKGTGLGLTSVRAIVEEYHGQIHVSSKLGKGTTVKVSFPRVLDGKIEIENNEEEVLLRGSERVLVVDDESPVRNVVEMSLQHLGYTVSSAASGEEALRLVQDKKFKFELVILDMLMPKMSGEQVYMKLQDIAPQIKVLVMSGFVAESVLENLRKKGNFEFIQKPFTIEELSKKVRKCLA
jgi:two-component system cell cycle sensor histidine kinase/response regulator CckA